MSTKLLPSHKNPKQSKQQKPQPLLISYLRFSTPEQLQGDSQRRQLEQTERWAAERGWSIDWSMSDLGVSAYRGANTRQGDLSRFLALVEQGRVPRGSYLLVEELDRITRQDPETALHLFLSVVKAGVIVVTLNTGDVFESGRIDIGRLMIAVVKFATANDESRKKSERAQATWNNKRRNAGKAILTRSVPNWCRVVDGRIVPDPPKAAVVRKVYQLALKGYGAFLICQTLNQDTAACELPTSKQWNRTYVRLLLHDRAVLGEYSPKHYVTGSDGRTRREPVGDPVAGYYPRVIDPKTFDRVQATWGKGPGGRGGGPTSKWINLFGGLLYDAQGGTSLVVANKSNSAPNRIYAPYGALERRKGSRWMAFPVKPFEVALLTWLADPSLYGTAGAGKATECRADLDAAQGELAIVEAKIVQVQEMVVSGDVGKTQTLARTLDRLDARRVELAGRVEQLQHHLDRLTPGEGTAGELFRLLKRHQEPGGATVEERAELRHAVRRLVSRIDCDFERDGFDYAARCRVTLADGRQEGVQFGAAFLHPRAGKPRTAKQTGGAQYAVVWAPESSERWREGWPGVPAKG